MSAPDRSAAQNRALWATVGRLERERGLSRDDAEAVLRRIVAEVSGQASTRALSASQAAAVLTALEGVVRGNLHRSAPAARPARAEEVAPNGPISPAQQDALSQLWPLLGWHRAQYLAWCRRMFGVPWPQTRAHGAKAYEGLEAQLRRLYPLPKLHALARTITHAPQVSAQDLAFARSLLSGKARRAGAGQISILIKIGARYGLSIPSDEPVAESV